MVTAGKEMKIMMQDWDWERIHTFCQKEGIDYEVNKSADTQWENGCSEALIRLVRLKIL